MLVPPGIDDPMKVAGGVRKQHPWEYRVYHRVVFRTAGPPWIKTIYPASS
jgi:hypothetical protein